MLSRLALSPSGVCVLQGRGVSFSPSAVCGLWTARRKQAQIREQTPDPELLGTQRSQRGPSVTRLSALASDEGEESTFVWHVCTRQEHCASFFPLQAHAEAAYLRLAELTKGGAVSDHRLFGQLFLGA